MKTIYINDNTLELINYGIKKKEGRLSKGIFNNLKINDKINLKSRKNEIYVKIVKIVKYKTFLEMINNEGIEEILPIKINLKKGLNLYKRFYDQDIKNNYGAVVIFIENIKN